MLISRLLVMVIVVSTCATAQAADSFAVPTKLFVSEQPSSKASAACYLRGEGHHYVLLVYQPDIGRVFFERTQH